MYLLPYSEQDSGLQPFMLDGVHGAGSPGAVFVSRAKITVALPALAPGNGFSTISTAEETAEQVELLFPGSRPGITL